DQAGHRTVVVLDPHQNPGWARRRWSPGPGHELSRPGHRSGYVRGHGSGRLALQQEVDRQSSDHGVAPPLITRARILIQFELPDPDSTSEFDIKPALS